MSTQNMGKFDEVVAILERYNYQASKLVPILQQVQDVYRYLPTDVLKFIALQLGLPESKVYGVVTFYAHFALNPKGKYIFKLCDGTACHVKGSIKILDALQKRLGLAAGKHTTEDLMFTVETVSCLGCCGLAPALVVNEDVYGCVTPEKAVEIVETILKAETEEANA